MKIQRLPVCALFLFPLTSVAMDTSPFEVGQVLTPAEAHQLLEKQKARPVQPWVEPGSIDSAEDPELVKYGISLLSDTVKTIGPKASNPAMRYSGNSLNCSSCHLKGSSGLPGTVPHALPFVNMINDYPNFRAREMTVGSAEDRVNGCMTRSQGDGKPMPKGSKEMRAIQAYFAFLARGTKPGQAMEGTGLPVIDFPQRMADPKGGEALYAQFCLSCHQAQGLGLKSPTYAQDASYTFPPLAGPDSFNDGAGMSRLKKATRFIYANMPLGATAKTPALTVEQAYDIAAYVESLPRTNKPGREKDFPVAEFRPADYPVPEYFDGDAAALEKAKYGPFD